MGTTPRVQEAEVREDIVMQMSCMILQGRGRPLDWKSLLNVKEYERVHEALTS